MVPRHCSGGGLRLAGGSRNEKRGEKCTARQQGRHADRQRGSEADLRRKDEAEGRRASETCRQRSRHKHRMAASQWPLGGHVLQRASVYDGSQPYVSAQQVSNNQQINRPGCNPSSPTVCASWSWLPDLRRADGPRWCSTCPTTADRQRRSAAVSHCISV